MCFLLHAAEDNYVFLRNCSVATYIQKNTHIYRHIQIIQLHKHIIIRKCSMYMNGLLLMLAILVSSHEEVKFGSSYIQLNCQHQFLPLEYLEYSIREYYIQWPVTNSWHFLFERQALAQQKREWYNNTRSWTRSTEELGYILNRYNSLLLSPYVATHVGLQTV